MPLRSSDLLCEWRAPKTFERVLKGLRNAYRPRSLFTDPTLNRSHRELWAACAFCAAVSARTVRLTRSDAKNSDFEVSLRDGSQIRLQFVEADLPGRKRGDEYRQKAGRPGKVTADPYSNWIERRNKIPEALKNCIEKKVRKGYPQDVSLFIYLNIATYGQWSSEIERDIITAARDFGSRFRSVWVLWNGRLYRAWPNPSSGEGGPMFSGRLVRLGRWKEHHATRRAFNEMFTSPRSD